MVNFIKRIFGKKTFTEKGYRLGVIAQNPLGIITKIPMSRQDDQVYIECLDCHTRSFEEKDIKHRYCPRCHKFHNFQDRKS